MRNLTLALLLCGNACGGEADGAVDAAAAPDAARPDAGPDATPLPQCGNTVDDDGDFDIDYPWDPGCVSEEDGDEFNAELTECSNGIDDDGDGQIDYPTDPGCTNAADGAEGNFICEGGPSLVVVDISEEASASGIIDSPRPNELQTKLCTSSAGGEFVYTYTVDVATTLVISTDHPATTLDTVVYVRECCRMEATTMGCDDDGAGDTGGPSILTLTDVEPGAYFIIVDSFGPASQGAFELTVTAK